MINNISVLAIESSCDETAVSIVNSNKEILYEYIYSQDHSEHNGVVPELSSRSHVENIDCILNKCIQDSGIDLQSLNAIAATGGPGLVGGLIVGVTVAKAMSSVLKKKFIAINHLEGHLLTSRLCFNVDFPFLGILMSGGHCQFILAHSLSHYEILGGTLDDSIGEAFDKVSKMMNLGYPGGPIIEKLSINGNENCFTFPQPMTQYNNCIMSFSGLKTAVRNLLIGIGHDNIDHKVKCDIAASFQKCVAQILTKKLRRALEIVHKYYPKLRVPVSIGGGVAANKYIRNAIQTLCNDTYNTQVFFPPLNLCTDNATMIGWVAIEKLIQDKNYSTNINFDVMSRWPLDKIGNNII